MKRSLGDACAGVGAFLGFDFHRGADGPERIEMHTNSGEALLNGKLARAH